jgi:CubicO group peptidase (beta-lactamase class C family)
MDIEIPAGAEPHGVVVARGDAVVFEHYGVGEDFSWSTAHGVVHFGPDTLHDMRSITKSVVALLYGIALDRGQVPAPDEPLLRHFPEYEDLAADPRRAERTVGHALTMTLAFEWDESAPYTSPANSEIAMELAPDRYRFILDRPITGAPGQRWSYCGGASALLGGLIARGTGRSLPDFARGELFEPLGIGRFEWMVGDDGVPSAAAGLRLTPRALARIGQLVLGDGQGVVPRSWLAEALRPRVPTGSGQYGYQWYLGPTGPHRTVTASGNGGQRLFVLPDLDLVVAVTAGDYNAAVQSATPDAVLAAVLAAG